MTWDVFRQTPTQGVWACMGRQVVADTAEQAVATVTADLRGHLLGDYFAVRSSCVETFRVAEQVVRSRSVVVTPDARPAYDGEEEA